MADIEKGAGAQMGARPVRVGPQGIPWGRQFLSVH